MADGAIPELEARLARARATPTDAVALVDALVALAWALRTKDLPRAHALATEARERSITHGYRLGQARAARTMAMTMRTAEEMPALVRLAEEARALFDEVGDGPGRAASRDFLASIHEHVGALGTALDLAVDALAIAREVGDPVRQGYALSSLGGILAASGETEAAIERLEEALRFFESADEPAGIATICARLCKVLKSAGRLDEARAYAERSCAVAGGHEREWSYASSLAVLAELEDERGQPAEAERLYRAALGALGSEAVRNLLGAGLQVALGRLLLRQGALDAAERELNEAIDHIRDDPLSIVNATAAHEALAELCERQGKLTDAIRHLRRARALHEEIAKRDAKNQLDRVEARAAMDAAKKDAEIHKLRFVELHAMQSKLVQAERMAVLGKLAAGVAHELNTPLGVLKSNTQTTATVVERLLAMVRVDGALPQGAQKLATVLDACRQATEGAVGRIDAVTQSFRRFTSLDEAELRAFDVCEGLDAALVLLAPSIPPSITIERRFDAVPPIVAWPRELNQAFLTVLQNAVQAIDGVGSVLVEARATEHDVVVVVRDTGRGMSEEQARQLFELAWSEGGARTKMRMGLSAALQTAHKHGGTVTAESAPGAGTTVTFRLPITPARDAGA
ncbi:ATP-binding protein [Myxococcota bacterium]|nr:ATP-binding protein [Myxococcota bacterium]